MSIESQVIDIIKSVASKNPKFDRARIDESTEVRRDAKLEDDLGLDSLDTTTILIELEEEFGIDMTNIKANKTLTVNDLIEHVRKGIE